MLLVPLSEDGLHAVDDGVLASEEHVNGPVFWYEFRATDQHREHAPYPDQFPRRTLRTRSDLVRALLSLKISAGRVRDAVYERIAPIHLILLIRTDSARWSRCREAISGIRDWRRFGQMFGGKPRAKYSEQVQFKYNRAYFEFLSGIGFGLNP
jgi:hypothetical protein